MISRLALYLLRLLDAQLVGWWLDDTPEVRVSQKDDDHPGGWPPLAGAGETGDPALGMIVDRLT